jgi:hypothetical protein
MMSLLTELNFLLEIFYKYVAPNGACFANFAFFARLKNTHFIRVQSVAGFNPSFLLSSFSIHVHLGGSIFAEIWREKRCIC